ncbi:MAG: hypothetical protein WCL32_14000 [Planctomycetota bacterium]
MNRRAWLCVSAIVPCLLDVAVTMHGQPAAYWSGDYFAALECNPLPRIILWLGPWPFAVAVLAWLAFIGAAISFLPWPMAIVVSFIVATLHGLGAGSWMFSFGWMGAAAAVGVLVFVEQLMSFCWQRAGVLSARRPPTIV